jgi:carbon monoxide dehydrogenase subunit G
MHLEGTYKFNITQEALWNLLNDPAVLARTTPGIKELQPQGDDKYQALFEVKMGPINSTFDGTLEVADKVDPESYKLLISVDGKIGTIAAAGTIALQAENEDTILSFQGDAKLTGVLARMGQRVLSGVGRMFTNQFFKALEKEFSEQ